jgi:glycine cleavage system regulatory protein
MFQNVTRSVADKISSFLLPGAWVFVRQGDVESESARITKLSGAGGYIAEINRALETKGAKALETKPTRHQDHNSNEPPRREGGRENVE